MEVKLSEIRARDQSAPGGARFDVPYLLDLLERTRTALEELLQDDYTKHMRREDVIKARAVLEELER